MKGSIAILATVWLVGCGATANHDGGSQLESRDGGFDRGQPVIAVHEFKRSNPVALYYSKSPFATAEYHRTGKVVNLFMQRPAGPLGAACAPRLVVSCWDRFSATAYLGHDFCTGETDFKESLGYICTRDVRGSRLSRLDTYTYRENWGGTGWWRNVYAVSATPLSAPWQYKFLLGFTP